MRGPGFSSTTEYSRVVRNIQVSGGGGENPNPHHHVLGLKVFFIILSHENVCYQFVIFLDSNQALLHFDSVSLNPYPPQIPGNVTVSGHLVLGRDISGHIQLQVSVHYRAIFWVPIPCLSGFGSW